MADKSGFPPRFALLHRGWEIALSARIGFHHFSKMLSMAAGADPRFTLEHLAALLIRACGLQPDSFLAIQFFDCFHRSRFVYRQINRIAAGRLNAIRVWVQ
jgi:hypothetical protein